MLKKIICGHHEQPKSKGTTFTRVFDKQIGSVLKKIKLGTKGTQESINLNKLSYNNKYL